MTPETAIGLSSSSVGLRRQLPLKGKPKKRGRSVNRPHAHRKPKPKARRRGRRALRGRRTKTGCRSECDAGNGHWAFHLISRLAPTASPQGEAKKTRAIRESPLRCGRRRTTDGAPRSSRPTVRRKAGLSTSSPAARELPLEGKPRGTQWTGICSRMTRVGIRQRDRKSSMAQEEGEQ